MTMCQLGGLLLRVEEKTTKRQLKVDSERRRTLKRGLPSLDT